MIRQIVQDDTAGTHDRVSPNRTLPGDGRLQANGGLRMKSAAPARHKNAKFWKGRSGRIARLPVLYLINSEKVHFDWPCLRAGCDTGTCQMRSSLETSSMLLKRRPGPF